TRRRRPARSISFVKATRGSLTRKAGSPDRLAIALCGAACGGRPQPARAQDPAGALVLDGVQIPLRHAYASPQPGFFDKSREDIRVLLSDVPLPDAARSDVFALMKLGRQGE